MSLDIAWLGCDLVSGQIIEELQALEPAGPLASVLGTYTSANFTLPLPGAPRDWEGATTPGRTMLVAVLGSRPVWAGIVLTRKGGTRATVDLPCVSLEGYLDRRYVGDHTWTGQDEVSVILAGLLGDANSTEGIGFELDCPATGTNRDRTYQDQDDKTVYSACRELMAVEDGPEWTVVLDWTDDTQTAVAKIARARKRLGTAAPADLPAARFDTQGASSAVYELVEDYSSGRGANHVVAVSSGQGDVRPQSTPARDEDLFDAGWPRWEHRFTPSTSISSQDTLDAHARAALAIMGRGALMLQLTARADAYPQLGADWLAGDDIGVDLLGHRHPDGLSGIGRCIGWELDPKAGLITPTLYTPEVASQ
jgi:hypothetical protein